MSSLPQPSHLPADTEALLPGVSLIPLGAETCRALHCGARVGNRGFSAAAKAYRHTGFSIRAHFEHYPSTSGLLRHLPIGGQGEGRGFDTVGADAEDGLSFFLRRGSGGGGGRGTGGGGGQAGYGSFFAVSVVLDATDLQPG